VGIRRGRARDATEIPVVNPLLPPAATCHPSGIGARWAVLLLGLGACARPDGEATVGDTDSAASGELLIEQIGLSDSSLGESALIVGPDGTSVLLDVGNDAHADDIRAALDTRLGARTVDWIVLTHAHADHIGGFDALGDLTVRGGVVSRGAYDLGPDANRDEWDEVAATDRPRIDLCTGTDGVAAACDGWELDLGGGATFRVDWVDGWADGAAMDVGDDDENARSLGGTVEWGPFAYVWGGDTTGGGKGTPDMEGFLLDRLDLPVADVLHLDHHGIDSATADAWVEQLLPDDGADHNALVGATGLYLSAPDDDVLDRVTDRLGDGRIWATATGMTAGHDERLEVVGGSVTVRVAAGGARYTVQDVAFSAE
jgi:competence protein ComEC